MQGQIDLKVRKDELGHDKGKIDKMHTACHNVKDVLQSLPRFVERLE